MMGFDFSNLDPFERVVLSVLPYSRAEMGFESPKARRLRVDDVPLVLEKSFHPIKWKWDTYDLSGTRTARGVFYFDRKDSFPHRRQMMLGEYERTTKGLTWSVMRDFPQGGADATLYLDCRFPRPS